jgi:uncharacterized protein YdaU (DUF1376 family)
MNYYPHHLGDYAGATAHLSWDEDMAYTRLIRVYYLHEKPIPEALPDACRLARAATAKQKEAIATVLNEFFQLRDDGWRQDRCDQEIAAFHEKSNKAKRSAVIRWNALHSDSDSNVEAMRTHSEGNAIHNHNQDPKPKESKEGRASRFTPPTVEQVKAYCAERKNGIDAVLFVESYAAKGWVIGKSPMKSWKSAVITWERRNDELSPCKAKPNGSCPPITDEKGLLAYGDKHGLTPRAGEGWQQFRSRVMDASR